MRCCGNREHRKMRKCPLRADGSVIYLLLPRWFSFITKIHFTDFLHSATPPTPEQSDFAQANPHISCSGGTRNPSVLLSPEIVCSVRQDSLSGTSGRKRYNTLDFTQQNRVPTGRFRPSWKPQIQGTCHPFEIPAVLESVPTSCKSKLVPTYPKTKNPPSLPLKHGTSRDLT